VTLVDPATSGLLDQRRSRSDNQALDPYLLDLLIRILNFRIMEISSDQPERKLSLQVFQPTKEHTFGPECDLGHSVGVFILLGR